MEQRGATDLPGIQILRGIAACSVLIHHVLEESQPLYHGRIPPPVVLLGASGVDLFFVISGFIMFYTNRDRFGRAGAATQFLARRVMRIVPLYWLCILAVVALHAVGLLAGREITPLSLVASLAFLPTDNIVLGVGWTLNYEMYFYVVFALWLLVGSRRAGIAGVLTTIPLITALSLVLPPSDTRGFLGNTIAVEFCFGVALGVAFTRGWIPARAGRAALIAGAAGVVLGAWFGPNDGTGGLAAPTRVLFWGLPAAALLIPALVAGRVKSRVGGVLLELGDASYSIYLTHVFVMVAYSWFLKYHLVPGVPRPAWVLMPILASVAVGLAAYRLAEQPMNKRIKLWLRGAGPTGASSNSNVMGSVELAARSSTPM